MEGKASGSIENPSVPTAEQYYEALSHLVLTPNQMNLLLAHYRATAHTATEQELVRAARTKTTQGLHVQYGRLADRMAKALNWGDKVNLLWALVPQGEREPLYVLRPQVAEAIAWLGWAKKRSRRSRGRC